MTWSEAIARALKSSRIEMVAFVPDEVTDPLLTQLEEDASITVVSVTREEEGVGVLSGAFLGGKRGVLILQGSGLGNSINALSSLSLAYQIPFLIIVSERGRLGEFNPAQVPLGRALPKILDALGIQAFWAERVEDIPHLVDGAARLAFSSGVPVAMVLPTALTGGKVSR